MSATSLLSGSRRPADPFLRSLAPMIRGSGRPQPPPTRSSSRTVLSGGDGGSRSFFTPWRGGKGSRLFQRLLAEQPLQLQHWVLQRPVIRPPAPTCWSLPASAPYPVGRSGAITKSVLASQHACVRKSPGPSCGSGESLATAARQGDKTTTSDYQARQSRPCDRTGNGRNRGEQDIPD
jgi:hypothetical protein